MLVADCSFAILFAKLSNKADFTACFHKKMQLFYFTAAKFAGFNKRWYFCN
jgi:hypothetical protein